MVELSRYESINFADINEIWNFGLTKLVSEPMSIELEPDKLSMFIDLIYIYLYNYL